MAKDAQPELLLGKQVPVTPHYAPELLYPIPRSQARLELGIEGSLPFHGVDLWHLYELSWLDASGKPVVAQGRLSIPVSSRNLVESKSLKLYLNSLNSHRFDSREQALATMQTDITATVGAPVKLDLFDTDDQAFAGVQLQGQCIDQEPVDGVASKPAPELLTTGRHTVTETLYSHLLRSLCPVTGQPDWASVWLRYTGPAMDRGGLLAFLLGFRNHQEFHEQCVERIYCALRDACQPDSLTVQALYTRRGGLDICPLRSTGPDAEPLGRINRQ
ncbi:MAG: NADPH-dependent 7-cyano-7-deazaguanine reductase QueF [Pseudomonadota bacterium]